MNHSAGQRPLAIWKRFQQRTFPFAGYRIKTIRLYFSICLQITFWHSPSEPTLKAKMTFPFPGNRIGQRWCWPHQSPCTSWLPRPPSFCTMIWGHLLRTAIPKGLCIFPRWMQLCPLPRCMMRCLYFPTRVQLCRTASMRGQDYILAFACRHLFKENNFPSSRKQIKINLVVQCKSQSVGQ